MNRELFIMVRLHRTYAGCRRVGTPSQSNRARRTKLEIVFTNFVFSFALVKSAMVSAIIGLLYSPNGT